MGDHDENGKFKKGNRAGSLSKKPKELRILNAHTRLEVCKCAHSLTKPWNTLKEDVVDENASRLEYLTARAVSKGNYKFIQWLIEASIGKAPTLDLNEDDDQRILTINGTRAVAS